MKRLMLTVMAIICTCCLGCSLPYQGERPFEYPSAVWVSEYPDMWFVINEDNQTMEVFGKLCQNKDVIEIIVSFGYYGDVGISSSAGEEVRSITGGECKYNPDWIKVKTRKKDNDVLDADGDEITFVRYPLDRTNAESMSYEEYEKYIELYPYEMKLDDKVLSAEDAIIQSKSVFHMAFGNEIRLADQKNVQFDADRGVWLVESEDYYALLQVDGRVLAVWKDE